MVQVPDLEYLRYMVMVFPSEVVTVLYSSQVYAGADPKMLAPETTDPDDAAAVWAGDAEDVPVEPAVPDDGVLVHPATSMANTTPTTIRMAQGIFITLPQ